MPITRHAGVACSAIVSIGVLCSVTTMATPQKPPTTRAAPPKPVATARAGRRVERPVPFRPGETLSYDVVWSTASMTAGTATLSVRDKRASFGSTAYYIVGEGRSTPELAQLVSLYVKVDTLIDSYTLLPQRGSVYSDGNGRKRMTILSFNRETSTAQFEMQTTTVMKKDLSIPPAAQDMLSALYVLRAMALEPGARISMPVCTGDVVYQVTATVGSRERVETGLGTLAAHRIATVITNAQGELVLPGMVLWVSADARRLPLRLQTDLAVGGFTLVLREAK